MGFREEFDRDNRSLDSNIQSSINADSMNASNSKKPKRFICAVVGSMRSGKSAVIQRMKSDVFSPKYTPTTMAAIELYKDEKSIVTLTDCSGDQDYSRLRDSAVKSADLIIMVYSIDEKESLQNIKETVDIYKGFCKEDAKFILLANKIDLREKFTKTELITTETGRNALDLVKGDYFIETSAKTGENISLLYGHLIKLKNETYSEEMGFLETFIALFSCGC